MTIINGIIFAAPGFYILYSELFMQVATSQMSLMYVPQAGYFHCCIIHEIKPHGPHGWHQITFAMSTCGH